MNTRVITTIGIGIAVLVGGWAYYAVLSTMPTQAPSVAALAPSAAAALAVQMGGTGALLNSGAPNAGPGNAPIDPNAPGPMSPGEVGPPSPIEEKPAPTVPAQRAPAAEKWDLDLEKKPIPIDVK